MLRSHRLALVVTGSTSVGFLLGYVIGELEGSFLVACVEVGAANPCFSGRDLTRFAGAALGLVLSMLWFRARPSHPRS